MQGALLFWTRVRLVVAVSVGGEWCVIHLTGQLNIFIRGPRPLPQVHFAGLCLSDSES